MTENDGGTEPDFDDPAHSELRDLLGSARLEAPIPAAVAARLEATLADLSADRARTTTVVPLRRRPAPRLLVAAAAIVIAGAGAVGLGQVLRNNHTAADTSVSPAVADREGAGDATGPTPTTPRDELNQGLLGDHDATNSLGKAVPRFSTARFAAQAAAFDTNRALRLAFSTSLDAVGGLADLAPVPAQVPPVAAPPNAPQSESGSGDSRANGGVSSPASPTPSTPATTGSSLAGKNLSRLYSRAAGIARRCNGPQIAGTLSYRVLLDGGPAVLVVHRAKDGHRLVEAWTCSGSKVLAYASVPR